MKNKGLPMWAMNLARFQPTIKKCCVILWYIIATIIISMAILITTARLLTPKLQQYQQPILEEASLQIGYPLAVRSMKASWLGLHPVIKLSRISILNPQNQHEILDVNRAYIAVDVMQSLLKQKLVISQIVLADSHVLISINDKNEYYLGGPDGILVYPSTDAHSALLQYIFSSKQLTLKHFWVTWNKNHTPFHQIYLDQVTLLNDKDRHRLLSNIHLTQDNPTSLVLMLNIFGHEQDFENWHVQFYLSSNKINFSEWLKTFDFFPQYQLSGTANFSLWGDFKTIFQRLQLKINWEMPIIQLPEYHIIKLEHLSGDFAMLQNEKNLFFAGEKIKLNFKDHAWPQASFYIERKNKTNGNAPLAENWSINFDYLNLDDALPYLLPNLTLEQQKLLDVLKPHGILYYFGLQLNLANKKISTYNLLTQFEKLSLQADEKWPALQNLTGIIKSDESHGEVQLSATDLYLKFPKLFHNAHHFDKFFANVYWNRLTDAWLVKAEPLYFINEDGEAKVKFALKLPEDNSSPSLQLQGSINAWGINHSAKYFPVGIMPHNLVSWLDQAILNGQNAQAQIVLQGKLKDFPYQTQPGTFTVKSQVKKINLNYYPQWPKIENLDGTLLFDRNHMLIEAESGDIFSTKITHVRAEIDDLLRASPQLIIKGQMSGTSSDGLTFLKSSPLYKNIGSGLDSLQATGKMLLSLNLFIPLNAPSAAIQVDGQVKLIGNKLTLKPWDIVADQLNSAIHFTEKNIQTTALSQAQLWNNPVIFSINSNPEVIVQVNGKVDIESLNQQFNFDFLKNLKGNLNYQTEINFPSAKTNQDTVIAIHSSLLGTKVDYPAPLNKGAQESIPFDLNLYLNHNDLKQLKFIYGQRLSAALSFKSISKKYEIYSGEIAIATDQAAFQKIPGILLSGIMKNVHLSDFGGYLKENKTVESKNTPPGTSTFKDLISRINLKIFDMNLGNLVLPEIKITGHKSLSGWSLNLVSTPVSGNLTIPRNYPSAPINIHLNHLILNNEANDAQANLTESLKPNSIPPIRLISDNTVFGSRKFGRIQLFLQPQTKGVSIQRFSADTPNYNLIAQGNWLTQGNGTVTMINGQIQSRDVRGALADWQLPQSLTAKQMLMNFNLNWQGTPFSPNLPSLHGHMNMQLNHGKIIGMSEGANLGVGLGRLINLLSLESLSRKLHLDFSDLTVKGYTFEKMTGNFTLAQGYASTYDAKFDSNIADVQFSGDIGYVNHDYDLDLSISPNLTSSLPTIVAIAGGPVAGIATLAAEKLIKSGLKKVTTYHYKVNGSWDKPQLKKK